MLENTAVAKKPLVTEVYTTAQNVMKEALTKGHRVGTAMSLETGWNFVLPEHREASSQAEDPCGEALLLSFGFSMRFFQSSTASRERAFDLAQKVGRRKSAHAFCSGACGPSTP